jgi:predicted transposase YbfD/YdcC
MRAPSQSTFQRIFKALDVVAFEAALARWAEAVLTNVVPPRSAGQPLEAVAVDGKALRGSQAHGATDAFLLSALSQRLGVVLGTVAVSDKTNEIGAMPDLLAQLVLTGRVFTTDAMLTQRSIAQTIHDGDGDYLLVVKDNQSSLRADIEAVFAARPLLGDTMTSVTTINLHGDRIEERVLTASTALVGYCDWPGHAQVVELRRTTTNKRTGATRQQISYAITSLSPQRASAGQLLEVWREHWHIESKLHWVRDVTWDEDRSQVRAGHAPQVLAALRNVVLGVLRVRREPNIAAALRRYAAQPAHAARLLGIPVDFA